MADGRTAIIRGQFNPGDLTNERDDVGSRRISGIRNGKLGAGIRFVARLFVGVDATCRPSDHGDLAGNTTGSDRRSFARVQSECGRNPASGGKAVD